MRINKHDTQGTKPLLGKGELGYDDYVAGGDVGRVYVGTGSENIALAEKSEIDSHVNRVDNPHSVTKAQVGLGSVDNTADVDKNVLSATKWTTARTITLSGDVAGSVSMDGTANVSITTTVQPNSVALGTDTTGNYVAGITQGTGITVSGTAGEGWSPTVAITNVGTAGTYTKVTTNAQGQVTSGTTLAATDIPALDASKITTGIIDAARLPAFVDDVLEFANQASFPATGESGKIYVALDTNKTYRWSGSVYVYITSGAVDSVNGQTGVVNITTITGNAGTATKLQTSRNIALAGAIVGSVNFDGSADVSISTTLGAQSFIQSSGLSSSWGSTNGTSTGAVNAIMGTSSSATWLLSGTSGGVFRSGIQSLDSNGTLRLYSNSNYIEINGNQITGNISTASALATGRTIGMTGDVTWTSASFNGSGNVTGTSTLATITDSGTGTFKKITTNTKGLVTGTQAVAQADITGLLGAGSITNTMLANTAVANLSGTNTGDQTITLTGDVTGTGTGSFATTLSNSGATPGSYSKVTIDAKGRVTAGLIPTMEDIPDATFKRSVRVATTANITLSATQTIDGIVLVVGDRVLVKDQTAQAENGIYVVSATAWTRSLDADTSSKIASAIVAVDNGTVNGGKLFDNDFKTTDTLGTTAMPWASNLDSGHLSSSIPIVAGTGSAGTAVTISRSDHVHPAQTTITGNAGTATTLQTARTISGVSFNGSANIDIEDRLGTAIASAATTTIGTRGLGDYIHITGTTAIMGFGTAAAAGVRRTLIFDGALTLTHNATSLVCPGAANIVTVAGTVIEVVAETTANWRVVSITHPSLSMAELGYLDGVTSAIQTQINAKAPIANPTFTGTVSGITKTMVGLGYVDNTADLNKPVSTATQNALDTKQEVLVSGANIKTINGTSVLGSGDIVITGGSSSSISYQTLSSLDTVLYIGSDDIYVITTMDDINISFNVTVTPVNDRLITIVNNSDMGVLYGSKRIPPYSDLSLIHKTNNTFIVTNSLGDSLEYRGYTLMLYASYNGTSLSTVLAQHIAKYPNCEVTLIGGGGGGGSGRKGATSTAIHGGQGGTGGAISKFFVPSAYLSSGVSLTIGAGGAGGASQTTNSTNGNDGSTGGDTYLTGIYANLDSTNYIARGGVGGRGGTSSTVVARTGSRAKLYGLVLPDLSSNAPSIIGSKPLPPTGIQSLQPTAGGTGGGITTSNVAWGGGDGGSIVDYINSLNVVAIAGGLGGNVDSTQPTSTQRTGAGGGAGSVTTNAQNGASNISEGYGCGGGGGGASTDGVGNSGAGGKGGDGLCIFRFFM